MASIKIKVSSGRPSVVRSVGFITITGDVSLPLPPQPPPLPPPTTTWMLDFSIAANSGLLVLLEDI